MKRIITSLLCGLLTLTSVFADDNVNKEQREIAEFNKIEASKGLSVMLIQCDRYAIEVVTQGCPTSDVETIVKNNTLYTKMKKKTAGSAVSVFVYYKDIDEIKIKTGASVETNDGCQLEHRGTPLTLDVAAKCEATLDIDVDELIVSSNSCEITLSGKAIKQNVKMKGTVRDSKYDAAHLWSEEVDIFASGCDSEIYATKHIKAEAEGCTIKYRGDAQVEKTIKSKGKIVKE